MTDFDPTDYAPAITDLVRERLLMPLGPGRAVTEVRAKLESLRGDDCFRPHAVIDRDMANACRAGLWLLYDFLDESHGISQELETPEGSYWHAIMHRREPDYSNSKYWSRRVGRHAVHEALGPEAARLGWKEWDALAFVDLCEANAAETAPKHPLCREVQRAEWERLFAFCYERAVAVMA